MAKKPEKKPKKKSKKSKKPKVSLLPMVINKKKSKRYRNVGRKKVFTQERIAKFEHAIAIGSSISMACCFADVSRQVYYTYIKEHPEYIDRVELLQSKLPLLAMHNIAVGLRIGDVQLSERYLNKRFPEGGIPLEPVAEDVAVGDSVHEEEKLIVQDFHKMLKQRRLERSKIKAIEDGELKP